MDYKVKIMKTLYESILGSTKSGKIQLIKDWCNENITCIGMPGDDSNPYKIDNNGKIIPSYPGNPINLKYWNGKSIPSYIKFGDFGRGNFFSSDALNELKNEQLPENCSVFYISGKIDTIPSRRIKAQFGLSINEFHQKLTNIEKLEIECSSKNNRKPVIDISLSNVKLSDVLNITVIGDIYNLKISKTPAAKELLKIFKKQESKSEPDLNRGFISKELNEMFKNFPELRYIQIGDRTSLEHNPKTDKWYKI
jgi:hypothetical protein